MAVNPFDQFDSAKSSNPFDQFDEQADAGALENAGRLLKTGANTAAQDVRELVGKIPLVGEPIQSGMDWIDKATHDGKGSEEILKSDTEAMQSKLGPAMKEAVAKKWWDQDTHSFGDAWKDPRAWESGVLQSLPEQALMMFPAMRIAKSAYVAKIAAGATAEVASASAAKTAQIAGTIIEGGLGGAQSSRQVRDEILDKTKVPDKMLATSEAYKSLIDGGLSPEDARKHLADDRAARAFITAGVATGIFGGMGDRFLAKIITGTGQGALKRFGMGALSEGAAEEFPQSYLQQVAQNEAVQGANKDQSLTDDALNQAFGGMAAGGLQGGGMAAIAGQHAAPPVQNPSDILDKSKTIDESIEIANEILDTPTGGIVNAAPITPITEVQNGPIIEPAAGTLDTGSPTGGSDNLDRIDAAELLGNDDGAPVGQGIAPGGGAGDILGATGQNQPVPDGGDAAVTFADPHEERISRHFEKAEKAGIPREHAEIMAPEQDLDHVTGFYRGEEKGPTLKRAQDYVEKTGQAAHYVDADIANLGGINAHFENNADVANQFYRGMADIFREEMEKAGSRAVLIRQGGDEISAVVIGGNAQSIAKAMAAVHKRTQEYASENGLGDIPYGKRKDDKTPYGTGIYMGAAEIQPGKQLDDMFKKASATLNKSKEKGLKNVTYSENEALGTGSPDQQTRRSEEGDGGDGTGTGREDGAGPQRVAEVTPGLAGKAEPSPERTARVKPKKPRANTLLTAVRDMGGLSLSSKSDVAGDKIAPGGYNQLFRTDAKNTLEGLAGKGELDEFLPYELRFATNDQPGGEVADMQDAVEWIKDRIRSGERIIPYDAQMELDQRNIEAQALIDAVEEELSYDEINAELQLAADAEREDATNARIFNPSNEESGAGSSAGTEAGKGAGAEADTQEQAFQLQSQTNAEIAAKEAREQDTAAEDKAAADRAADVPFTLSAQTQEKPAGAQAGMFTPDGRATVAAEAKKLMPDELAKYIEDDSNIDQKSRAYSINTVDAMREAISIVGESSFEKYASGKDIRIDGDLYFDPATRVEMVARKIVDFYENKNLENQETRPTAEAAKAAFFAQPTSEAKTPEATKAKKLDVIKAQAKGEVTGDQAAALKELADAGEHAAVDAVLKPSTRAEVDIVTKMNEALLALIDAKVSGDAQLITEAESLMRKAYGKEEATPMLKMSVDELRDLHDAVAGKPFLKTVQQDAIEAPAPEAAPVTGVASGEIGDAGEKLGGARKDLAAAIKQEYSDDDIASLPLSKIWPADLADKIEDKFVAAFAFAARQEIPSKPRVAYKVKAWATKVKILRDLAALMTDSATNREKAEALLNETRALDGFNAKIRLMEAVDREQWKRIGKVWEYPNAYTYDADGKQVPASSVLVEIDEKRVSFDGAKSVADVIDLVNGALGVEAKAKRMAFTVRGNPGSYYIHKDGDPLYRKLKTFTDSKEALNFRRDNYDELVAAWEAVKDSDNVKEADLRSRENRERTAEDWRKGKDVTPEQFVSEFGFRGIEFGNWVSQGKNTKERQGMLNAAYDALMDLSNIINVPPKALSLEGTLGLGFGSRGSGAASAHFEPDMLVINLTKTRGAGTLAHEWFHALDNYFQLKRGKPATWKREEGYITYSPENYYVHKGTGQKLPQRSFERMMNGETDPYFGAFHYSRRDSTQWELKEGVRPEVGMAFADLVKSLNDSPMAKRASLIDKGKGDGYWSRIIERGARSFENYIIHKMMAKGYHNDYLANVTPAGEFARDVGRYPYLLEGEIAPVAQAFDNLFSTIQTKETDKGTALYSRAQSYPELAAALEKYEGTGEIATVQDLANEVDALIGEDLAPDSLQSAIDTYRDELSYSDSLKGRGDMDSADEAFIAAIESILKPLLSRGTSSTYASKETVQRAVDTLIQGIANAPDIITVQSSRNLPFDAPLDAKGAFWGGKVYLVADNLSTDELVRETVAHEMMGHYGLHGFFGRKLNAALLNIHLKNPRVRALASEWVSKNGDLIKNWHEEHGAKMDVNEFVRMRSIEEAMSEIAQTGKTINGIQRFVATLQKLLRSIGLNNLADMLEAKTDAEAMSMLKKAEMFVRDGSDVNSIATESLLPAFITAKFSRQSSIPGTQQLPTPPPRQGTVHLQGGQTGIQSTWVSPSETMFDDIVYKLQNKNIDLKRVIEAVKSTGTVLADKYNAYLQEELFHGRAAKRTQDFVNTEMRPLLDDMRMRGLTIEQLDEYLHARHAKEANALIAERDPDMPDGGSGMTNQQADDYMEGLSDSQKTRLDAAAKRVDAIIAKTRDMYSSYGLVSKNDTDAWGQMFQHYVPLMREDHDGGMGMGQGFSVKGKEVKHRTGSTAKVVDILANIALQREKVITRGEKNRVAVSLAGLVKLNPNPDFWTFGKVPTERVLNEKTGLVEERIDPMFKSRPNAIVAKISDGKGNVVERAVIFNESNERAMRMAESLKNLDAPQLGGLMGASAQVTRYFASVNTQYNPVFGITNIVRDVQGMALNLDNTPLAKHKLDVLKEIPAMLKGIYQDARMERKGRANDSATSKLWEELQDEGGMTGYRDLYRNSEDRANAIKHELDPHNWVNNKWGKVFTAGGLLKVPLTKAQDVAGPIFDWLSDYNQTLEGATRLATYKVALDNGFSKQQAASLAKNITVNFNRKGQIGQQAGALYAFFNAAMQGTARIGQTIFAMDKGDIKTLRLNKTGKKIVYGGVLLGVMQAAALAAAGFGDDEPPEFVRERNLIIPFGNKKYISIPMPLGYHVLPNIGRIATEFVMGGFKNPSDHVINLAGIFAEAFNPIGSAGLSMQTIAPTSLDPFAALAENKDWTGKHIAKPRFDTVTPGFSHNKDTATTLSKLIAEAINTLSGGDEYTAGKISPTADQLDYLAGQVGGGVWREGAKLEQAAASTITGEELPTHKIPLVGRFYGDAESKAGQGGAYYSNLQRVKEVEAGLTGRMEDRLPVDKFKRDNPEYRLIERAKLAESTLRSLNKRKREMIDRGMPREKIKLVEERITLVMRRFNESASKLENETAP